jgi:hypothetical protein
MQAAMDLMGFKARTMMPPDDVQIVETSQPGFVARRIRLWTSYIYSRLGKRYKTPFGLAMGVPTADGTSPPAVTYSGTPLVGSLELVLYMVVAGAIGTTAFNWSIDGGNTLVSGVGSALVTAGGAGYTGTPTVTLSPPDLPWGTRATATASLTAEAVTGVAITSPGTGYLYPPTVAFTGGGGSGAAANSTLAPTQILTADSTPVPGTGVSALFPVGTYSIDNIYLSASPVPEIVLMWLTAYVTIDAFKRRGVNPQDPMIAEEIVARDQANADLKEASDTNTGLFDLPFNDDTNAGSGIAVGGPLGYSEASPYRGHDLTARRAHREDGCDREDWDCG